ncbi:hypothetical protein Pcinc_037834 [Petrolisthes cinctipes]|uniref:Metalloendopeptidase n=1 Tax=Petrolisthes cinctipes TaxID=88211 RepID=A0AAE1BS52_PETCI|nr:hypothetical protein Pcinc_037834 [Petrolisthes cinctipes]
MAHFNNLTCVRMFLAKANDKRHHILVNQNKPGCFSFVGYTKLKKGNQDLNLHKNCFYGIHKVVFHETLHALGFKHTQVRYDRDDHIKVYKDRVSPKRWKNFVRTKGVKGYLASLGLPYDYNSILHYPPYTFSNNKKPTIKLLKKFKGELG